MLFRFAGGLGMFLYGMNVMADGLQKSAGDRMKHLLEFLTRNRLMGILVGSGRDGDYTEQLSHHGDGGGLCERGPDDAGAGSGRDHGRQYRNDDHGVAGVHERVGLHAQAGIFRAPADRDRRFYDAVREKGEGKGCQRDPGGLRRPLCGPEFHVGLDYALPGRPHFLGSVPYPRKQPDPGHPHRPGGDGDHPELLGLCGHPADAGRQRRW